MKHGLLLFCFALFFSCIYSAVQVDKPQGDFADISVLNKKK